MADSETLTVYDQQAEKYAEVFMSDSPEPMLIRFIERLPVGGRVLDLGCGPGNHSAYMRNAGFQVDATDASGVMVEKANERHHLDAYVSTFDDLKAEDFYDGVWANFSLLHASRSSFPKHLSGIAKALRPGGFLHLGMKTGSGEKRDRLGRYYTYYSPQELSDALEKEGFEIVQQTPGEGAGLAGPVEPWITMTARRV